MRASSFADFKIGVLLKNNLARAGFTVPTPIQAAALAPALEGRDILGTAQTGTGKTLAFLLPILERLSRRPEKGIEALVLLPTRELALQVLHDFKIIGRGTGIPVGFAVGGLSEGKQLEGIRRGARVIIATPGRLDDFLRRGLADLGSLKILVLDEADRMVDMGFLPQMQRIMRFVPRERQTMCFSATLNREVAHLVREYLKDPVRVEIGLSSRPAEKVDLKVFEVPREQKFPLLIYLLQSDPGTFLIFTRTKFGANKVLRKLLQKGFDADVLHSGKTQAQRIRALEGFKKGDHRVLVATDIASRGIHVHGIRNVINYDMPQDADDFIHRVGRTGRVEETGTAITFVLPEEARDIQGIERAVGKNIERLPLPPDLPSEPRSLHDEAFDWRSRRAHHFRGTRHFGRRRRY